MKCTFILLVLLLLYTSCFIVDGFNVPGQRVRRNAIAPTNENTWTEGIISYFIANNQVVGLDARIRRVVRSAMAFIENRTCVTFARKRTFNNRIVFVQDSSGEFCFGRNEIDEFIVLTDNCGYQVKNVVRLIMQSMGLVPNSVRPDRNTFMTVNRDNFNANLEGETIDLLASQLPLQALRDPLPPFEFGSILSYGPFEFSSPANPTFVATEAYADYQNTMGTGRITFQDIKMINDLYSCGSLCAQRRTCLNGGYQNPNDCELCVCPEGYSGLNCAVLPSGNVTDRTQGVNLMATSEWTRRFIEFGQDPSIAVQNEFKDRVDWITAPADKSIEVRVINIYEHPNLEEMPNPGCTLYGVELKTESTTLAGVSLIADSCEVLH